MTSTPAALLDRLARRAGFAGDLLRLRRAVLLVLGLSLIPLILYLATGTSYAQELGSRGSLLASEPWRVATAWTVHASPAHLAGNLMCILGFGLRVAYLLGVRLTLLLVVLAELASTLSSALVHPLPLSMGASGIVFALIGACAATLLARPSKHLGQWLCAPALLGWGMLTILVADAPGVDTAAHTGGFLAGTLAGLVATWWLWRRPVLGPSGRRRGLPHGDDQPRADGAGREALRAPSG